MAYYDPNSIISSGGWSGSYTDIDDGVRSPTAAQETDQISQWESSTTIEIGFPEPTATVTAVRVWAFGWWNDGAGTVAISRDGTNWESAVSLPIPSAYPPTWGYCDFSVSWAAPTDFRLRITKTTGVDTSRIYAVYLETTETVAGTGLPRRAIDGPFYGSLRGSVR